MAMTSPSTCVMTVTMTQADLSALGVAVPFRRFRKCSSCCGWIPVRLAVFVPMSLTIGHAISGFRLSSYYFVGARTMNGPGIGRSMSHGFVRMKAHSAHCCPARCRRFQPACASQGLCCTAITTTALSLFCSGLCIVRFVRHAVSGDDRPALPVLKSAQSAQQICEPVLRHPLLLRQFQAFFTTAGIPLPR